MSGRCFKVVICRGPECGDRRGSSELQAAFTRELAARELVGLAPDVILESQSCFGRCTVGPNVLVREVTTAEPATRQLATMPGPRGATALYNRVTVQRVARIIDDHLVAGRVVREFIERPPAALPIAGSVAPVIAGGPTKPGAGPASDNVTGDGVAAGTDLRNDSGEY